MTQRFVRTAIMGLGVILIVGIGVMVWQSALPTPCQSVENPPPSLLDKIMARIAPCTPQQAKHQHSKPTGGNGSPGFPPPD